MALKTHHMWCLSCGLGVGRRADLGVCVCVCSTCSVLVRLCWGQHLHGRVQGAHNKMPLAVKFFCMLFGSYLLCAGTHSRAAAVAVQSLRVCQVTCCVPYFVQVHSLVLCTVASVCPLSCIPALAFRSSSCCTNGPGQMGRVLCGLVW